MRGVMLQQCDGLPIPIRIASPSPVLLQLQVALTTGAPHRRRRRMLRSFALIFGRIKWLVPQRNAKETARMGEQHQMVLGRFDRGRVGGWKPEGCANVVFDTRRLVRNAGEAGERDGGRWQAELGVRPFGGEVFRQIGLEGRE